MKSETDTMYYIHKDYLGSYDMITDEQGNVLERLSFDPWGRRRNPTDWTYNHVPSSHLFDRGYTGHEHLDIFGLINMNGRVYDPWLGRFLSADPFVQAPGYSQSYNRFSYCLNNPLKYVDPSGYTNHPNWWDPAEVVCWECFNWLNATGPGGGFAQMNQGPSMSDMNDYNTYRYYNLGPSGVFPTFSEYYFDGYYSELYGMKSDYPHNFTNIVSDETINETKGSQTSPAPTPINKELIAAIKDVLLSMSGMMFEGTLEEVLLGEENYSLYLIFNGYTLALVDNFEIIFSAHAVAGKPNADGSFDYSIERQKLYKEGPIPQGDYTIDPQQIQWWTDQSFRTRTLAIVARGDWPGGLISWGIARVWITSTGTIPYGRSNFSIHGGWSLGSAGCIDLGTNALTFFRTIENYISPINLFVRY